ncbi:fungal-specific transcription factor domain-containing protein [Lipomyces arxii]|uniref:fungal-specific transcription factor domain-containing protein n=1 Tax=Lipomyces arxii TaxID=56418 RepID=UPI0034CD43E4
MCAADPALLESSVVSHVTSTNATTDDTNQSMIRGHEIRSESAASTGTGLSPSPDSTQPPRKQRKVHLQRQRVSRACDNCKRKKTRCSGNLPCVRCVQLGLGCEFTAEYHRGRPPSPEWSGLEVQSSAQKHKLSRLSRETTSSASPLENITQVQDRETEEEEEDENFEKTDGPEYIANLRVHLNGGSTRNSPEPPQLDSSGQYVGSSSGISFLMRVQKRLRDIKLPNQSSSILTFGDPELPKASNAGCFILPPKAEGKTMIDFYFSYAMPTYRFLHRPTVERWLEDFYDLFDSTQLSEGAREHFAIIIMLFAHSKKYPGFAKHKDSSALYFHAAEQQLKLETGRPRLTSVQARLCQCYYLLSCSRINHCRSLFGTMAHLIQALGLHRRQKSITAPADSIEQECRKRAFWCAYGLDKYLSVVLGRPSIFHDEDIDQDLPALVNDEDLSQTEIRLSNYKAVNCVMLAPVLHATLMRTVSGILRDLYSIRKVNYSDRVAMSERYTRDLKNWRQSLPAFLDPLRVQPSLLMSLLQRQSQMLTLAYSHAVILVNRPFLLPSFASLSPSAMQQRSSNLEHENAVKECVSAALMVVELLDDLTEHAQFFSALWFTQYVAFCAVVVLYVYAIQCRSEGRPNWQQALEPAMKCQAQIKIAGEDNNSLACRYAVVLEELRVEVIRDRNPRPLPDEMLRQMAMPIPPMQPEPQHLYSAYDMNAPMMNSQQMQAAAALENGVPGTFIDDLTSWENFDTLVMDFIGNIP